METVKFDAERQDSPNIRTVHTRSCLIAWPKCWNRDTAAEMPPDVFELVRFIFEIPGVAFIEVQPYQVTLEKGELFERDEILPAVKKLLEELYPPSG